MLLPAVCPHCDHGFSIPDAYVGVKRICPECDEKFLFQPAESVPSPAVDQAEPVGVKLEAICPH